MNAGSQLAADGVAGSAFLVTNTSAAAGALSWMFAEWIVNQRPTILVFGESLGAWSSSDVVMHQGIGGFDHYGIDRALWFGLPGLAKWSKTGMRQGSTDLVPPGTVAAFDRFEQYEELTPEAREKLRAVVVDVAGERRWIAAEDAGLYRDALGVPAPRGLPES